MISTSVIKNRAGGAGWVRGRARIPKRRDRRYRDGL